MFVGGAKIYAIIEAGGKQYQVAPGQTVDVDHLDVKEGSTVDLDKVLLIVDGDKVMVGRPTIEGAKVVATALGEKKGKKVIVFEFKAKTRHSVKTGHRQLYTTLTIDKVIVPGAAEAGEPVKKTRRSKKEVTEGGT